MSSLWTRRGFLRLMIPGTIATGTGCGTILYPERRGQPHGKLDWGVVAMDGVGLLLFFVPGVIAFAVDFATGAIYLPPEPYGSQHNNRDDNLERIEVGSQLTRTRIEQEVSAHTSEDITLEPGGYETRDLKTLDEFWATCETLETAV